MISFVRKNWMRCATAVFYQIFMAVVVVRETLISCGNVSFEACWFASFCGNLEFEATQTELFELPVLWIIFHAYLLYMIGNHLQEQSSGMGLQRMIRIGSRRKWYLQIFRIDAGIIFSYYLCYALILMTVLKCQGIPLNFGMEPEVFGSYLIACFLLPVCAIISVFSVQNAVSLYHSPYVAYIFSLVVLVCSSYWKTCFLIGNYAMLLRTDYYRESGLSVPGGWILCIVIMVAAVFAGLKKTELADYIGKESDRQ